MRLILKGVRDDDRFGIVMPTSAVSLHLRTAGPRISGMAEAGRDRARFGTLEVMVSSGLWTRGCHCVVSYLLSGCRVALLVISLCYWSSIFHVSVTSTYLLCLDSWNVNKPLGVRVVSEHPDVRYRDAIVAGPDRKVVVSTAPCFFGKGASTA